MLLMMSAVGISLENKKKNMSDINHKQSTRPGVVVTGATKHWYATINNTASTIDYVPGLERWGGRSGVDTPEEPLSVLWVTCIAVAAMRTLSLDYQPLALCQRISGATQTLCLWMKELCFSSRRWVLVLMILCAVLAKQAGWPRFTRRHLHVRFNVLHTVYRENG